MVIRSFMEHTLDTIKNSTFKQDFMDKKDKEKPAKPDKDKGKEKGKGKKKDKKKKL